VVVNDVRLVVVVVPPVLVIAPDDEWEDVREGDSSDVQEDRLNDPDS
jgi:hypothetical protein